MAFGFGFNKQKVLSAAEKFVQQGKLPNAIAEYEKVLKADPKDLTVANTVGDLYSRLGQNDKALECFKSVGDAYAAQGFTVKAIAMYKKLTKLKTSLESVLRLAELYTQQGLFNDARAQYLQVAEEFLRAGEFEQAVRIFQKTLEMDPENVAMRMRLAEVYIRLNKKTEAWQIFSSAAESLRARGSLGAAEEILQRMLTLDPGNSYALLLRGRNALESGDIPGGIKYLEKVADLDTHPEGLRSLMQAYLLAGRLPDAGNLAAKLFSVHNDTAAITGYADALMAAGNFDTALEIYSQYCDRLLATESAKILDSLHAIIGHVRENTASLETILNLLTKAGETTHVTEIYELLAHAYVQSGELDKAREFYLKLTQLEPQNQLHSRNYQQVMSRLGNPTSNKLITPEEGAVMVDELEATAPFVDQRYADDVAIAVRAALTDAELFVSYNMPAKALGPLLSVLPRAPQDLRLNQRLAALHTRAARFTEAAVCCRTLETIYHDAGHPEEATRYAELASKYEELTSASLDSTDGVPIELHVEPDTAAQDFGFAPSEEFSVPASTAADFGIGKFPSADHAHGSTDSEFVMPEPKSVPAAAAASESGLFFHTPAAPWPTPQNQPATELHVESSSAGAHKDDREIDLSSEWEGDLSTDAPPAFEQPTAIKAASAHQEPAVDEATVAEVIEEIRFYLVHSMVDQANIAMAKLKKLNPGAAQLHAMREEIETAIQNQAAAAVEEVSIEEVDALPQPAEAEVGPAPAATLNDFVSELESSLGDGFLAEAPVHHVEPGADPERVAYAHAAETEQAGGLGDFVTDLESSLGDNFLAAAPVPQPAAFEPVPAPIALTPTIATPMATPMLPPSIPSATGAAAAPAKAKATTAGPAAASPTFTYQPTPIRQLDPAAAAAVPKFDSGAGVDLADMFGELKHELEEDAAHTDEDPETHYNLGVAFREMGLLDEAIGELQKVCQAAEQGHTFPQIMQTYTWLAQCFLDKGVPEAAIRWYEQALKLPTLDADTRTALHYELAASFEVAGNKPAALTHFMEVYGSNIDYRDVSERIKALKS